MLAALPQKLTDILNGTGGRPSPIAGAAKDVLLGDRLNEAAKAATDSATALADSATALADSATNAAALAKIVSDSATVLNGGTTVVVAVGAAFNGKVPVVSFAEAPTAATLVWAGAVAGGNLTINIDQDNTADLLVAYVLDGR